MPTTSAAFNSEVLRLTNKFRLSKGLNPLRSNSELDKTAQDHSKDMALRDYFAHKNKQGEQAWDRAKTNGYTSRGMAENIAAGQRTPESVVNAWINSPGHRKNMLNPNYTELGTGFYNLENDKGAVNYTRYWTQVFGAGDLTPNNSPQPKSTPTVKPKPVVTPVVAPVKPKPVVNVAADKPVAYLNFNEGRGTAAKDTSSFGRNNSARLLKGTRWTRKGKSGRAVMFDGRNDRVAVANSRDINQGTHDERTVSMWFKVNNTDTKRKQVIYDEGSNARGMNAYVQDDLLYFGSWGKAGNNPASFVKTNKVSSGKWHHMALVLDGQSAVKPNAFTAYLDGHKVGSLAASQMLSHDAASLGNLSGSTKFHDGKGGSSYGLYGAIDEVKIYNDALSSRQVNKAAEFI